MSRFIHHPAGWMLSLAIALMFTITGCNSEGGEEPGGETEETAHGHSHEESDLHEHEHGAWWCGEHGVPEEECSMCSATAAAEFKEAGDWCEEHDRADSQCFICHPENVETFAALYRAKYGEEPPALPE